MRQLGFETLGAFMYACWIRAGLVGALLREFVLAVAQILCICMQLCAHVCVAYVCVFVHVYLCHCHYVCVFLRAFVLVCLA